MLELNVSPTKGRRNYTHNWFSLFSQFWQIDIYIYIYIYIYLYIYCDGFKQTSRNLEVFLKVQRTKEELTCRTSSMRNGDKTKLNSNSVFELSLSHCLINHMSEIKSPTNRNLILISTDLQLMNLIVSRPYMILMKS